MAEQELAELIRRYRAQQGLSQTGVAERLSVVLGRKVGQSQVSDNEKGSRWSDPELPGAYAQALEIPGEEMVPVAKWPAPTKAAKRPPTLTELIRADPSLSAMAKKHMIQQYGLLQLASKQDPGPGLGRSAAR